MSTSPRTPPRFVPTLTAVVDVSSVPTSDGDIATPPPTRDLPSDEAPSQPHVGPASSAPTAEPAAALRALELSDVAAFEIEEELLHRVLQRVDLSLEERMTDVISAAVQQQLDAMLPRLRSEIEGVLRTLLVEALAHELSENSGSTPGLRA